jgi:hypothetical protein
MKDHTDKSIGVVTHIAGVLDEINPTDPFRFFCLLLSDKGRGKQKTYT